MVNFKTARDAAALLAPMIGGEIDKDSDVISIGKDATVTLSFQYGQGWHSCACGLRAVVGLPFAYSKQGWTAIKLGRHPATAYRDEVKAYSGDLNKLAAKLLKLLEPLKGAKTRHDEAEKDRKQTAAAALRFRQPYMRRLAECGLCVYGEREIKDGRVLSLYGLPFSVSSDFGNVLKVSFTVPYDKAEKVLTFLKEELG